MDLPRIAHEAGIKLYGSSLLFSPPDDLDIEFISLRDVLQEGLTQHGGDTYVDDFEYVFKPSTGEGIDASGKTYKDHWKEWVDVDGYIYTYWYTEAAMRAIDTKGV